MILITGASGFIGSCLAAHLNRQFGRDDLLLVDHLDESHKWRNLNGLAFHDYLDRAQLWDYLQTQPALEAIVHLGACTDTGELDSNFLIENNYRYSLGLAQYAVENDIRFVYASSAATYGGGEHGYDASEDDLIKLRPLNGYGFSKQIFDLKASRMGWFSRIAGLKFFNVYGPNEYHKGKMASVVFHAFHQVNATQSIKLFRSHRSDVADGQQKRDFIYVKDVIAIICWLLDNKETAGLFNVGSGRARSFSDLARAVFKAMDKEPQIQFIDTPLAYREGYQYLTCADMSRSLAAGLPAPKWQLEDGIADYIHHHLSRNAHY